MKKEEIIIQEGESKDVNEIIDFGNFVFSMAHRPHNFADLLPKCYGPGQDHADWHYLVREEGQIQAMLMSMPQQVSAEHCYPGVNFLRYGIGTVSVHHRARSKGYMRQLMHRAIADMQDAGAAYSFLGGQRQRYRYYGYEHAGTKLNASLSLRNMTMTWPSLRDLDLPEDLRLIDCPDEGPILDQVYDLYLKNTSLNVRPKDKFTLITKTFGRKLRVLLREDELLAYVVASSDFSTIDEFVKTDGSLPWEWALYYFYQLAGITQANFSLVQVQAGDKYDFHKALLYASENFSLSTGGMYLILDFAKTIAMLLADKASRAPLAAAKLTLTVEDCLTATRAEQKVHIEVTADRLIVASEREEVLNVALPLPAITSATPEEAELSMSYFDCVAELFSFRGYVSANLDHLLPAAQASWFPLNPTVLPSDNA